MIWLIGLWFSQNLNFKKSFSAPIFPFHLLFLGDLNYTHIWLFEIILQFFSEYLLEGIMYYEIFLLDLVRTLFYSYVDTRIVSPTFCVVLFMSLAIFPTYMCWSQMKTQEGLLKISIGLFLYSVNLVNLASPKPNSYSIIQKYHWAMPFFSHPCPSTCINFNKVAFWWS